MEKGARPMTATKKPYFFRYNEKQNEYRITERTGFIKRVFDNYEGYLKHAEDLALTDLEARDEQATLFLEELKSKHIQHLEKLKQNSITKKVTPLENTESTTIDTTHTIDPPSPPSNLKGNTKKEKVTLCLSVWEKLHRHDVDISDPEEVARLAYYSKHQDLIKKVIDPFQVLTASDGVTKANLTNLKVSRKIVFRLLDDLHTDGLLKLDVIPCGLRNPAYVYSTDRCNPDRYSRYTKKFRKSNGVTKKVTSPKRSHDKKGKQ